MKKFRYLTLYNLKKAIFTKGFIISNIILLIVVVLLLNMPKIVSTLGGDKPEEVSVLIYYDNLESENDELLSTYLSNTLSEEGLEKMAVEKVVFNLNYGKTALPSGNLEKEKEFFQQSEYDILIWFENTDDFTLLRSEIHYKKGSSKVQNTLVAVISQSRVIIENVSLPIVNVTPYLPDGETDKEAQIMQMTMLSLIISMPMLFIVMRALIFVGVDIVQEKSSKAIETIISSVPTRTHFFSKVLASLGFVIIQSLLLVLFGVIGSLVGGTGGANQALGAISLNRANIGLYLTIALAFTLVSSLFYLIIGGLLAAMANSQEDYQVVQGPLTMLLLAGFYVNMFSASFGSSASAVLKVISYIPPLSGFVAPYAFSIGAIMWWELLISFIILLGTLGLVLYFFGPVYRVSILSYEQTKFSKRIVSNFKKARLERRAKKWWQILI